MAKYVTNDEVIEFYSLYQKYGTYAEVARRTNRSPDTVARYIKAKKAPKQIVQALTYLSR